MTLEHLDTIIVFVVIITSVRLLITTLARMVSALLGLRGSRFGCDPQGRNDPSPTPAGLVAVVAGSRTNH